MENKINIYFWQDMPNIHEAGYISSLSALGYKCVVIFQRKIPDERIRLGVEPPCYGEAEMIFCPPSASLPEFVYKSDESDVHFMMGVRAFNLTRRAFIELRKSKSKIIIISESRRSIGFGGALRYLSSWLFEGRIRRRVDAVLAMGDIGVKWFKNTGYKEEKVFNFCYSVKSYDDYSAVNCVDDRVSIAFVGAFINRKNPNIIASALNRTRGLNLVMHWYGVGELESKIKRYVFQSSTGYQHVFHGAIVNSALRSNLKTVDILILPSVWDGWGAVTVEAVMAGCKVIVSDNCGSSSIINENIGRVFKSGDVNDLADKIFDLSTMSKSSESDRRKIINWSKCINGDSVANYMISIISYLKSGTARPDIIWKDSEIN